MKKINFEDLPSTDTPINSVNLNTMQDNIENAIDVQNVITAGTNLDDYTETGTYFFKNSEVAPINVPAGSNGWLVVIKGDTSDIVKQIWYRFGSAGNHFQTFVRTKLSGVWSEWKRLLIEDDIYYKNGDTFTNISNIACIGHLTSSSKDILFTLPVEKRLDNISSITINSISANIRHADGGYIVQGDLASFGTITSSKSTNNLLRIRLDLTTATTLENNVPLAVDISNINITFNE